MLDNSNSHLSTLTKVLLAWTYHYQTENNMDWLTARQWCQRHFTDMVAIQNQGEIAYLDQILPIHRTYYWIGIRKVEGEWMWVGTRKPLTDEAANWATGEPNNQGSGEDCVEMYIKRLKDTAKWNDERCNKRKAALCYKASCFETSCSEHAECVEIIGNYKCQCHQGFTGPRCEQVVQCPPLMKAVIGWNMNCSNPINSNSYSSTCTFSCEEGFELVGSPTTQCDHTGHWTQPAPTCTGTNSIVCFIHPSCDSCENHFYFHFYFIFILLVKKESLETASVTCGPPMVPANGNMTCTGPLAKFSFRSSCALICEEGYSPAGESTLTCLKTGNWSAETPTCEARQCPLLFSPENGWMNCSDPHWSFSYGSLCSFGCEDGHVLTGEPSLDCTVTGSWSQETPFCDGKINSPVQLFNDFVFGSQCMFQCSEGYRLNGTSDDYIYTVVCTCHLLNMPYNALNLRCFKHGAKRAAKRDESLDKCWALSRPSDAQRLWGSMGQWAGLGRPGRSASA
uniref:E-selectin n=1 Tax=Astyanax mexicanus TaxID=7994 RepID=A0A3B1J9R4_ASTMX